MIPSGAAFAEEGDLKSLLQFVKETQPGASGGRKPRPAGLASQASATWRAAGGSRTYLENGYVTDDVAVLNFLTALEAHRKKCEKEGKYMEARQAARRLRELKEQEVGKRRAEMADRHGSEREQAERAYAAETELQMRLWEDKLGEYERAAADKLARLHEVHLARLGAFRDGVEATRPTVAHKSRELLEQRRVEESLARLGKYVEAATVKSATDKREEAELAATLATYENEVYLKEQQLLSKQLQEAEALQQRIARGRDELKKTWALDAERRLQRYKNVMAELETLHRLEAVQLEHFLGQQVLAGKQAAATLKPRADDGVTLNGGAEAGRPAGRAGAVGASPKKRPPLAVPQTKAVGVPPKGGGARKGAAAVGAKGAPAPAKAKGAAAEAPAAAAGGEAEEGPAAVLEAEAVAEPPAEPAAVEAA